MGIPREYFFENVKYSQTTNVIFLNDVFLNYLAVPINENQPPEETGNWSFLFLKELISPNSFFKHTYQILATGFV